MHMGGKKRASFLETPTKNILRTTGSSEGNVKVKLGKKGLSV
jgi:hypothetical protein